MQSLKSQIRLHVGKIMEPLQRKTFYVEMHRYFVLFTSTCGKQRKGRGDTFCICREWFCNVVFGKDIATGPRPQNPPYRKRWRLVALPIIHCAQKP